MTGRHAAPEWDMLAAMKRTALTLCALFAIFSSGAELAYADTVRSLTTFEGEDREPAVSPDGKWLAYLSDRKGDRSNELWLIGLQSGAHRALLTDMNIQSPPAWTPDSKQLIIAAASGDAPATLRSYDITTATLSGPLFPNAGIQGRQMFPDISPDGKTVTFTLAGTGENAGLDLYIAAFETRTITRLTSHPENDLWSRFDSSGNGIVFFSRRDTEGEADDIYHMNVGTWHITRLTDAHDHDFVPSPSPDGAFIAFSSRREGSPALYVMRTDGTSQRRLSEPGLNVTHPAWGPDSKAIYFTGRPQSGGSGDIMVMSFN